MITVKDVAKDAGVSLATVSRVINGATNVSPEIKARVLSSIKALHYFPNNAARSLVRKRVNSIAVVLRNLHSPFYSELICGFEDCALALKKNLVFCSIGREAESRDRYLQYLTNGITDGIILYGMRYSDLPLIEHLQEVNFPFLLSENSFQTVPVNQMLINNVDGATTAVEHLISKGHRRIAHIMSDPNKSINLERLTGYTNAMQKNGLRIDRDLLISAQGDEHETYETAKKLMELPPDVRPTALFCCNERRASQAVMGIQAAGYSVPKDISVICFDRLITYRDTYTGPELTHMHQPLYQIGYDSIQYLVNIMSDPFAEPLSRTYDATLVEMDSVGPVPEHK